MRQQASEKALRLQRSEVPRQSVAQRVVERGTHDVHDAAVAEQAQCADSPRRAGFVDPPQRLLGGVAEDRLGCAVAGVATAPEGEDLRREIGQQARHRRLTLPQRRLQLAGRGDAACGELRKNGMVVSAERSIMANGCTRTRTAICR